MFWRRKLPHWVPDDSIVFVTWRLIGTLPKPEPKLLTHDPGRTFLHQDRQLDRLESGPRWLTDPRIADLVAEAVLHGERARGEYELFAWVVMPNHIHIVLKPNKKLPETMRWLKSATAIRANQRLGRTGEPFWQREYYDRWIRSGEELTSVVAYVEANPVKAGFAASPADWPWSSAWNGTGGTTAGAPVSFRIVGQM